MAPSEYSTLYNHKESCYNTDPTRLDFDSLITWDEFKQAMLAKDSTCLAFGTFEKCRYIGSL